MIKPSDVPPELVKHYLQSRVGNSWPEKIASDLNAAIESGVVSPPCYCVRWGGELQILEGTDKPKLVPGKPWANDTEHWKGQTS